LKTFYRKKPCLQQVSNYHSSNFGVQGSSFGVQGSNFGVQGSNFGVQGSNFGVQGSNFGVKSGLMNPRETLTPFDYLHEPTKVKRPSLNGSTPRGSRWGQSAFPRSHLFYLM
jgi:hypothetical protein